MAALAFQQAHKALDLEQAGNNMINFNQDLVPTLDPNQLASVGEGIGRLLQTRQLQKEQAQQKVDMREAGIMSQFLRLNSPEEAVAYANMVIKQHPDLAPDINELLPDIQNNWGGVKSAIAGKLRGSPVGAGMIPGETQRRIVGTTDLGKSYKDSGLKNDAGKPLFQLVTRRQVLYGDGTLDVMEEPFGELTDKPDLALGQGAYASQYAGTKGQVAAQEETSDVTAGIKGKETRAVEQAKADVAIATNYKQALETARGQAQKKAMEAAAETGAGIQKIQGMFGDIEAAIANPAGFYTGDIMGKLAGGFLPSVGFVVNPEKLNNTAVLRMYLTQLKLGAKPAGSGNPTPSEWEMYGRTIPDPDTATPGQLVAAYHAYKKQVMDKYAELQGRAPAAPQGAPAQPGAAPQDDKLKRLEELRRKTGV